MKFSGVETVDVSLNKGLAVIKLKPGNVVSPEQVWQSIRKSGFTPRQTRVIIRGDSRHIAGKYQLAVIETGRTYDLEVNPEAMKTVEDLRHSVGEQVTIEGTMMPPKDRAAPAAPIRVNSVVTRKP